MDKEKDVLPSLGARGYLRSNFSMNLKMGFTPKQPLHEDTHKDKLSSIITGTGGATSSSYRAGVDVPRLHLGKLPQASNRFSLNQIRPAGGSEEAQTARLSKSVVVSAIIKETTTKAVATAREPSSGEATRSRVSSKSLSSETDERKKDKPPTQLPLTPAKILKHHIDDLTEFEQGEILDYPQVWTYGSNVDKIRGTASSTNNHGYDDERGDYQIVWHDHILYRYEMINPLGRGSFGQVVRAYDYKGNSHLAVKIIRNKKRFHHQALVEVKILEFLKERDADHSSNVVHMVDHFYFRNHLCIAFELLSINLYEFIKNNNFQGLSLGLIRRFAIQLLTALRF